MTGFGAHNAETEQKSILVEIKSLNSKGLDLSVKLPREFSDKELEIRNLVANRLDRGKVSLYVDVTEKGEGAAPERFDKEVIKYRYQQLSALDTELDTNLSKQELFQMAYQWATNPQKDAEAKAAAAEALDWAPVKAAIEAALENCLTFRLDEGSNLEAKLLEYNDSIKKWLQVVRDTEGSRVGRVKARIDEKLKDLVENGTLEPGRLEAEMMFYVEKLDINEEMVRLAKHLDYFEETIKTDPACGKKIGFISQEMGREINTIGSKANDADLQKVVVNMKEELEKIKEQSLNIL